MCYSNAVNLNGMIVMKRTALLFVICVGVLVCACNPCDTLAESACSCLFNSEAGRQRCLSQSRERRKLSGVQADQGVCTRALGECQCENLLRGDVDKCGMVRDVGVPLQ